MSLLVIDASALAMHYSAADDRRNRVTQLLDARHAMFAPVHVDIEVISALRGIVKRQPNLLRKIPHILDHLARSPIRRMPLSPLAPRIWELRNNVTAYDAAYVALAEEIQATLVTGDAKLAGAPGLGCKIDLV